MTAESTSRLMLGNSGRFLSRQSEIESENEEVDVACPTAVGSYANLVAFCNTTFYNC